MFSAWHGSNSHANADTHADAVTGGALECCELRRSREHRELSISVIRTGTTSGAFTANYATSDNAGANNCNVLNSGFASSRCDYETTSGVLKFAAGETSKTILIPIVDDVYAEGSESFTVTLSNPGGASLGAPSVATVTINDNETTTGTNPINVPTFFVRLHYVDFFTREPDSGGWRLLDRSDHVVWHRPGMC